MGELNGMDVLAHALVAERERRLRRGRLAAELPAVSAGGGAVLERRIRAAVGRGMVRLGGWMVEGGARIAGAR